MKYFHDLDCGIELLLFILVAWILGVGLALANYPVLGTVLSASVILIGGIRYMYKTHKNYQT